MLKCRFLLALCFAFACVVNCSWAQDFDASYDAGVLRFGKAWAMAMQADGKVVVGGQFTETGSGVTVGNLVRYNADGTVDEDFAANMASGANNTVGAVAVQADGKIVLAGNFTEVNGLARGRIARLHADGTLDTGFAATGAGFNGQVTGVAIQQDGRILVVGAFTQYSGTGRNRIARLNVDGTLDTGFNPGSGANDVVWSIALQADGKPVIAGAFTSFNGTVRNRIARLNTNGSLDTGIAFTGGANQVIYSAIIDAQGRFLIGGDFTSYNGVNRARIARLSGDGALDSSFDPGFGFWDFVTGLALDGAGRILVSGGFSAYNGQTDNSGTGFPGFLRLLATGALDSSFNPDGGQYARLAGSAPLVIAAGPNDSVYVGGFFADVSAGRGGFTRVTSAGVRDSAFNIGNGLREQAFADVRGGANGRYYLFGLFDYVDGVMRPNVARILGTGRVDTSFNPRASFGPGWFDNSLQALIELPDGQVWLFGPFTRFGNDLRSGALRLNGSGDLQTDPTAQELRIVGGTVRRAILDANGRVVVSGNFTGINATSRAALARLNVADAGRLALDTSFAPGSGPVGGEVRDIALDASGRLLVGGTFTGFSGTVETGLVRLSASGAVDGAFAGNVNLDGGVQAVLALAGDQVLIGGDFRNSGGFAVNGLDRLNSNGLSDPGFIAGAGLNGSVSRMLIDGDGNIVVVGAFTQARGAMRNGIARFGRNGAADGLFARDVPLQVGSLFGLYETMDGKLIASGALRTVNGSSRHAVARFHLAEIRRGQSASMLNGRTLANGDVQLALQMPDGGFLLVGNFTQVNGVGVNRIAKLRPDGSLDSAFQVGNGFNGRVEGAFLQPDGKVFLHGLFTSYNGVGMAFTARLNADGTRDASYQPPGLDGPVHAAVRQSDGRYIVAGNFTQLNGQPVGRIVRLNADGSHDPGFNPGTGFNQAVRTLALAQDGSLYAGGLFTEFNGSAANGVVKLHSNGSLAAGFSVGSGRTGTGLIHSMLLLGDGRLLIGGSFNSFAGQLVHNLVRLHSNGTVDTGFAALGGANGAVHTIAGLANGLLIVGGDFTAIHGFDRTRLAVLGNDGSLSTVFDFGVGFNATVFGIRQIADGRIAVAGAFTTSNGRNRNRFDLLYGSFEAAPVASGQTQVMEVEPYQPVTLQSGVTQPGFQFQWYRDGVLIEGATAANYAIPAAWLEDVGLYTALVFNGAGETITPGIQLIVRTPPVIATAPINLSAGYGAGATFSVGVVGPGPLSYQWYRGNAPIPGATQNSYTLENIGESDFGATFFVRITNAYGFTDTQPVTLSFDPLAVPGSVSSGFVVTPSLVPPTAIARSADGKLYLGGSGYLVRVLPDGIRDGSFAAELGSSPSVQSILIQPDGKILVGGRFSFPGNVVYGVLRLLDSGAQDSAFAPVTVQNEFSGFLSNTDQVLALALQADGKIVIGGQFTRVAGVERANLARLNANGTVDTGFVTNNVLTNNVITTMNSTNGPVRAIQVQGSNLILAGDFTQYRNTPVGRLVRIHSTAAIDASFQGGTRANGAIQSMIPMPDGSYVIQGAFTHYNGTTRRQIARIHATGALDTTFDPGFAATEGSAGIRSVTLAGTQHLVVAGEFQLFNDWPAAGVVRLNLNGTVDTEWALPSVPTDRWNTYSRVFGLPDGRVVLTGSFSSVGAFNRANIALLEGGVFPPQPPSILTQPGSIFQNPDSPQVARAGSRLALRATAIGSGPLSYQWYKDGVVVPGAQQPLLVLRSLRSSDSGVYRLRVTSTANGFSESNPVEISVLPEQSGPGSIDLDWTIDEFRVIRASARGPDGAYYVWAAQPFGSEARFVAAKYAADGRRLEVGGYLETTGTDIAPNVAVVDSSGRMIAGGSFTQFDGTPRANLLRLNANGSLDANFNPQPDGYVTALGMQPNGTILVGGRFNHIAGTARSNIARLLSTGAIDTGFVPGNHGLFEVRGFLLAADGRIYVSGGSSVNPGTFDIIRLNSNGSLDSTFPRLSAVGLPRMALDDNGRLIIVGDFTSVNGNPARRIARFSSNGVFDSGFGPLRSSGADGTISAVGAGPDGYIYIAGIFSNYDGFPVQGFARLDGNGKFDIRFPVGGSEAVSGRDVERIEFVGGKVLLTGTLWGSGDIRSRIGLVNLGAFPTASLALRTSTGDRNIVEGSSLGLRAAFTGSGDITYQWFKDNIAIPSANSPELLLTQVESADAGEYRLRATMGTSVLDSVMRLTLIAPDPLSPEGGLRITTGAQSSARTLSGSDGKLYVFGSFTTFNGNSVRGLVRFDASGNVDTAFSADLPFSGFSISIGAVQVLPDGKILVLGSLGTIAGNTAHLVRLNANGSLDTVMLHSGNSTINLLYNMRVQSNGQILLVGNFSQILGQARSAIVRLNANGSLDSSFATPLPFQGLATQLELDEQGRIVIAGSFSNVNGLSGNRALLRLLANGTLDNSLDLRFNNTPNLWKSANGSIYLFNTGAVATVHGALTSCVRLLADGSIDPTFATPTGVLVSSLAEDAMGRLYAMTTNGLVRLLPGGGIERRVDSTGGFLNQFQGRLVLASSSANTTVNGLQTPGVTYLFTGWAEPLAAAEAPVSQTLAEGATLFLRADFRGSAPASLQWFFNDAPIVGATGRFLRRDNLQPHQAGRYRLVAMLGQQQISSEAAEIQVVANSGRAGEVDLNAGRGLQINGIFSGVLDQQGRVWLAGNITVNGVGPLGVVRLTPEGQPDPAFNLSSRISGSVAELYLQQDGRVVLRGSHGFSLDGVAVQTVTILENGDVSPTSADTSFADAARNLGGSLLPAPGGKFWHVQARQDDFNITRTFRRLNADFTPDNSFAGPLDNGLWWIQNAVAAADGGMYLLMRRQSTSVSPDEFVLRRVTADGTYDPNFITPRFAVDSGSLSFGNLFVDAEGGLWITGRFDSVEGVRRHNIVRLFADGTVDPSFAAPNFRPSNNSTSRVIGANGMRVWVVTSEGYAGLNDHSGLTALRTAGPAQTAMPVVLGATSIQINPAFGALGLSVPVYAARNATYQWYRNGQPIPGATRSSYRLRRATHLDSGTYHAVVTTVGGSLQTPAVPVNIPSTAYSGGLDVRNAQAHVEGLIRLAVRQPDGRILVASEGAFVNGTGPWQLFRLNPDGSLHQTLPAIFNGSPSSSTNLGSSSVQDMAVDAQGRIYLVGSFTRINGISRSFIARLTADGELDTSWLPTATSTLTRIALVPNGQVVASGSGRLLRYHADGSQDGTLVSGTGPSAAPAVLHVYQDGRILMGGAWNTYNGTTANRLLRILPNGSIDPTFNVALNSTGAVTGLSLMADGRLVIAGTFTQVNGESRSRMALLGLDGDLLPGNFNLFLSYTGTAVTESGVIYGFASAANQTLGIARYTTPDSGNDQSFSINANTRGNLNAPANGMLAVGEELLVFGSFSGIGANPNVGGLLWLAARESEGPPVIVNPPLNQTVTEGRAATLTVQAISAGTAVLYAWNRVGDSTILSTGSSLILNPVLAANAGEYRVVVSNGFGAVEATAKVEVVPETMTGPGRIVVEFAGRSASGAALPSVSSTALAPNGTLLVAAGSLVQMDPVSGVTLRSVAASSIQRVTVDSQGRIYVSGTFASISGHNSPRLARLTADLEIDTSFVSALPADAVVNALAFDPEGGLYVGGRFSALLSSGRATLNLLRLNDSGAIDSSFDPDGGVGGSTGERVIALLLQSNGKLVVAGSFGQASGSQRANLVRYARNGTLDTTFNSISIGTVEHVIELASGHLMLGGSFTTVDGLNRQAMVRLTADGFVDRDFALPSGYFYQVHTIDELEGGQLMALGSYLTGSFFARRVALLQADGSPSNGFFAGNGFFTINSSTGAVSGQGVLTSMLLLPGGDLIVGGTFGRVNDDLLRTNIVRIEGVPQANLLQQSISFVLPESLHFPLNGVPLTATSSSGLPVRYELITGNAAVVDGVLFPGNLGEVRVQAVQDGEFPFAPATPVERQITFTRSYDYWLFTQFSAVEISSSANLARFQDFDGDGLANIVEYAFGTDPRRASGLPEMALEEGADQWVLYYLRPAGLTDISYRTQYSSDLLNWSSDGVVELVFLPGPIEMIQAKLPKSGSPQRMFFRVTVAELP